MLHGQIMGTHSSPHHEECTSKRGYVTQKFSVVLLFQASVAMGTQTCVRSWYNRGLKRNILKRGFIRLTCTASVG